MRWAIVGIIVLLTGLLVGFYLGKNSESLPTRLPFQPEEKGCTLEAKICPDGSAVGRVPPNCEFAPCSSPKVNGTSQVNTSCSTSNDCVLGNTELLTSPCRPSVYCGGADMSLQNWAAVNAKWFQTQVDTKCPSYRLLMCASRILNDGFTAVCQNHVCQKVSL